MAPDLRARTTGAPRTAADLDAALDAGRLTVLFQPVVDLRTGAVVAAEALARLTGQHGLVPPDEFVPLAERTGRIRRIDRLVLEQAVSLCAQWRRQLSGRPFSVGVNISVPDLDPGLADVVRALTDEHGVPADAIVLELTETVLSTSGAGHAEALRAVAALGCNGTLDDFGTGYSSLTHLRRFPVSGIKIDRQFVWDLDGSPAAARIARAIVAFGRDLGVHVVAEGIETRTQLAALQEAGCAFGQGYLFARPLPADELTAYLHRANRLPLPRHAS